MVHMWLHAVNLDHEILAIIIIILFQVKILPLPRGERVFISVELANAFTCVFSATKTFRE